VAATNRPQFSLKAVLNIIAVMSVPLAMIATQNLLLIVWGILLLFPFSGGCTGYLLGGWQRAGDGILFGILANGFLVCLWPYFVNACRAA
jgi:hypothetical protein